MTRTQRKQLQAVLDFIDAQASITPWQVMYLLQARGMIQDATEARTEMMADVAADEGADDEDREQAQNWSPADDCEGQREANLDDPRDSIISEFEQIDDMGRAFYGRTWTRPAK